METLYIIMPAYNEAETIREVIKDWYPVVENHIGGGGGKNNSRLVIIDDGSKDDTYRILCEEKEKRPYLTVLTKKNGGHGDTVLYGYEYALQNGASYIFQTDSDGQTKPEEFETFWKRRHRYDLVIGHRRNREDGILRVFVTKVLQIVVFLSLGVWVIDANTPFRLMHREKLNQYLKLIPKHFNLPNVILSAAYVKFDKENTIFLPITFRERQGGVNSINLRKICSIGRQAVSDFRQIKRRMDSFERGE